MASSPSPPSPSLCRQIAAANEAREEGNGLFKQMLYPQAKDRYSVAIQLLQDAASQEGVQDDHALTECLHKCLLNRAACLMKLQGHSAAGHDASLVLKQDPSNAKAHYRRAQALEAIGDLESARTAFAEAIKLSPSWREPRTELDALRARCKACPRLTQGLQDMTLVEMRALQSLNQADLRAARKQMELLLKDARGLKLPHWQVRAMLGLALVCEDEGESEGARDYLDAARQLIKESGDRLAELYHRQTSAVVALNQGSFDQARSLWEDALLQAEEMSEIGLAKRIVANLATAYLKCGDLARALEYGAQVGTLYWIPAEERCSSL